jgi:hypothetical protein
LDQDSKKDRTEEYFYKDITNFSTSSESEDKSVLVSKGGCLGIGKKTERVPKTVAHDLFRLAVPGDGPFTCEMVNDDEAASRIQGMKAKLREKKG